jgi:hypothetical protein
VKGPIDKVTITIDRDEESVVTFTEDDHLKLKPLNITGEWDPDNLPDWYRYPYDTYPAYPCAEIVVPSNDDILGSTDVGPYTPSNAYIGEYWATVRYNATHEYLDIMSKSYDPSPHALHGANWQSGSKTYLQVWVNDSGGNTVFTSPSISSSAFWEGEIQAEQGVVYANGGTASGPSIPDGPFPFKRIWTSNGNFSSMWSLLDAFNEGWGLVYVNGHSSTLSFMDHFPGIPVVAVWVVAVVGQLLTCVSTQLRDIDIEKEIRCFH